MKIDPHAVISILKKISLEEILPRFGSLKRNEIKKKKGGELVTIADVEAEKKLTQALISLLPDSNLIGEETFQENPIKASFIDHNVPTWIVDPIDGTKNFANKIACFAVMVALVFQGKTIASWIYDPIEDTTIYSLVGQGSWQDNQKLKLPDSPNIEKMVGCFPKRIAQRILKEQSLTANKVPTFINRYHCVGREYMDLARGRIHFLRFGGTLKPWDHTSGVMIFRELNGFDATIEHRNPYHYESGLINNNMMLARNSSIWEKLASLSND